MNLVQLKFELRRDEGVRLFPYVDSVGKTTIGVGRNLTDVGIREDESEFLLQNDITRVIAQLDLNIPWWRALGDVRQRVLVNMAFNLGVHSLLGFHKMLDAAQHGQYAEAADEMLNSQWAKQVGDRAKRLAAMMRDLSLYSGAPNAQGH